MQTSIDGTRTPRQRMKERLIYIPQTRFLKTASLGFHAVLADVLWARAVIYFGGHFITDKDYRWLYRILDAATTLDPKNVLPYWFGGTLLSLNQKDAPQSIAILEKGIKNNPDEDWRLYFLLGYNYYFHMNDYAAAAKYLQKAATMPGHPTYLPRLVATMYTRAGSVQAAIDFLKVAYNQYEDETVKAAIAEKIRKLIEEQESKGLFHKPKDSK